MPQNKFLLQYGRVAGSFDTGEITDCSALPQTFGLVKFVAVFSFETVRWCFLLFVAKILLVELLRLMLVLDLTH